MGLFAYVERFTVGALYVQAQLASLLSVLLIGSVTVNQAQEAQSPAAEQLGQLKTIVVTNQAKPQSEITVPAATSTRISLTADQNKPKTDPREMASWFGKEAAQNGLQSPNMPPWHIVVTYDQFDEDGDNVHSGTLEEYWAGPGKYKRIYKSDDFNQTDYATERGLYRSGDQRWANRAQIQVREEVIAPFDYTLSAQDFSMRVEERVFNGNKLQCTFIETKMEISDPRQYCFEPGSSILRYARGDGWSQTVYNKIELFQGRNLGREVDVTDGGKPYLKLRVTSAELLSQAGEAVFLPPEGANLLGDRISGVQIKPIVMTPPQWPASLRKEHFAVELKIIIGKNGHVLSIEGRSGPREAYKGCEDAVKKWLFKPYMVLNKPVEVEQTVICSSN